MCMEGQVCLSVFLTELVDKGSRVVPDATVESNGVVPKPIKYLLHLKGRKDILYQHTCLDGPWKMRIIYLFL